MKKQTWQEAVKNTSKLEEIEAARFRRRVYSGYIPPAAARPVSKGLAAAVAWRRWYWNLTTEERRALSTPEGRP
jgi:hypothetical protein